MCGEGIFITARVTLCDLWPFVQKKRAVTSMKDAVLSRCMHVLGLCSVPVNVCFEFYQYHINAALLSGGYGDPTPVVVP